MTESYEPGHFTNLREKLREGLKIAIKRATSQGEIHRVERFIRTKDKAVKQSAALYAEIRNSKKISKINKDLAFEIINEATTKIMTEPDGYKIQNIQKLMKGRIKAIITI